MGDREDNIEFGKRAEAYPCSKEENIYYSLRGFEHNSLPMDEFLRDHVWDDPRIKELILDALMGKFSIVDPTNEQLGFLFRDIIREAFKDYVTLECE